MPDAGYGTPEETVKLLQHATNTLNGHTKNRFQAKAEKRAAGQVVRGGPPMTPSRAQPNSFYGGTTGKPLPWFMGQIGSDARANAPPSAQRPATQRSDAKPDNDAKTGRWNQRNTVKQPQQQQQRGTSVSSFYSKGGGTLAQSGTTWVQFG